MELVMRRRGAVEQRRGRLASEAVALMRTLVVIEAHELGQTSREYRTAGEVAATKLHPPVFLENGALQPLDEPVRPWMARLGARVPEAKLPAGVIERSLELAAAVREHTLQGPARAPIERHEDVAEERRRGGRGEGWQQPRHPVGAGCVARRDLPDLAHSLELADVERVEAHQLAGLLRLDVARAAVARLPEAPAGALGQQPDCVHRLVLEYPEPGATRRQTRAGQHPLHGARRHPPRPAVRP